MNGKCPDVYTCVWDGVKMKNLNSPTSMRAFLVNPKFSFVCRCEEIKPEVAAFEPDIIAYTIDISMARNSQMR